MAQIIHATAVAIGSRGALIRGASGSGKSDLALRCMALPPALLTGAAGCALVADDQVEIDCAGDVVIARPPDALAGLLEVRGIGVLKVPYTRSSVLRLVVDLVLPADVPRLPDPPATVSILGVKLPLLRLAPFEASAPIKLVLALAGLHPQV